MTPFISVFLVNIATSFFKKWIYPKFGSTGVQLVLAMLSVVAALVFYFKGINASFAHILQVSTGIFLSAMALYEVLLKKFNIFK